jgi:hypothetical protein
MEKVKRMCPVCGTPNPLKADKCGECGADIERNLPAIRESKLPVPWREVGASLALGATALAVRAGVHLLRGLLQRRGAGPSPLSGMQSRLKQRKGQRPRRSEEEVIARTPQPHVSAWGRRAWGMWRSDGTSQWEAEEFFWERTGRTR